jgi:hypothetical protein
VSTWGPRATITFGTWPSAIWPPWLGKYSRPTLSIPCTTKRGSAPLVYFRDLPDEPPPEILSGIWSWRQHRHSSTSSHWPYSSERLHVTVTYLVANWNSLLVSRCILSHVHKGFEQGRSTMASSFIDFLDSDSCWDCNEIVQLLEPQNTTYGHMSIIVRI